jgi:hypothetical protein
MPRNFRVLPASSKSEGLAGLYDDEDISGNNVNKDLDQMFCFIEEEKRRFTKFFNQGPSGNPDISNKVRLSILIRILHQ